MKTQHGNKKLAIAGDGNVINPANGALLRTTRIEQLGWGQIGEWLNEDNDDHAAYIVKCVNSHEQLVEALTEIILHFRKGNLSIKDSEVLNIGSKALQIDEGVSND